MAAIPCEWRRGCPRACRPASRDGLRLGLDLAAAHHRRAANSFQDPGTPLSSCSPRSWNSIPDRTTRSFTVPETSTSPTSVLTSSALARLDSSDAQVAPRAGRQAYQNADDDCRGEGPADDQTSPSSWPPVGLHQLDDIGGPHDLAMGFLGKRWKRHARWWLGHGTWWPPRWSLSTYRSPGIHRYVPQVPPIRWPVRT